jgi:hypothetical protein
MRSGLSVSKIVLGTALSGAMLVGSAYGFDTFLKPTPEELAMKELPGYPGAAAVVLYREEVTRDDLHVIQRYNRIKVLTDEGKKYANVELRFVTMTDVGQNDFYDGKTVGEIVGRTIHADGTIIPFTGKPYLKVMEKDKGLKFQAQIFTLPDVEVGSILEYRYATRYDDHAIEAPDWFIQGDLYLKAAHYEWYPTIKPVVDGKDRLVDSISWFPVLPPGAKIDRTELPGSSIHGNVSQQVYKLDVKDVPPIVHEEFEPPLKSFSYRVMFNFTAYRTADEFWRSEGKDWSKGVNSFAETNDALRSATDKVVAGATTQDAKLRQIYAAVMALENTRFTRKHEEREDKAEGERVKTAADVLAHQRGTPTQLTELFLGMARSAGMKAYAMYVPDRSEELFTPMWLSFQQFDDLIAIVNVDGKDVYLDPGWRYTPYGHLAWQHTFVNGLRQTDRGTDFATTDGDSYKDNRTSRVANLTMDEKGNVSGKVDMTFQGAAAVAWRHTALGGDAESLNHSLQTSLEEQLPKTLEVKVDKVTSFEEYEKPLVVSYTVTGTMGSQAGKRLVMPVDLFLANESATFPHQKREQPVYFHYPHVVQDALRLKFVAGFEVEAVPPAAKFSLPAQESYDLNVSTDGKSFTTRRNYVRAEVVVLAKDYEVLRKFYSQFESKDQESVVLKLAAAAPQ